MKVTCLDYYGDAHVVDSGDLIDRPSSYGIFIDNCHVLLTQNPSSLRWELPGGGVDEGETYEQALIREFIEEVGVKPTGNFDLIAGWTEHFFAGRKAYRSFRQFYSVKNILDRHNLLADGNGEDSAQAKFIPIDELDNLKITKTIKELILQSV